MAISPLLAAHGKFSEDYQNICFDTYYRLGKPSTAILLSAIQTDVYKRKPSIALLNQWIKSEDWQDRIHNLDSMVMSELNNRLVQEKVKMLEEHTEIAVRIRDYGLDYLEDHSESLTAATAIKLVTEGIRIERESRGLPDALRKMTAWSDDELQKRIQDIISRSPVSIEPLEFEEGDLIGIDLENDQE